MGFRKIPESCSPTVSLDEIRTQFRAESGKEAILQVENYPKAPLPKIDFPLLGRPDGHTQMLALAPKPPEKVSRRKDQSRGHSGMMRLTRCRS